MSLDKVKAKFPNGELREKHPFYMGDAIRDIPGCLEACLADDILQRMESALSGKKINKVYALGCGTSFNACKTAAYTCRTFLGMPAVAMDAYDFELDTPPDIDETTLVISVSQSGGSLTTCLAQEKSRELGAVTVAVTGDEKSRLAREAYLAVTDPYRIEIPFGKTRSYLSTALQAMLSAVMTADIEKRRLFIGQAKDMVDAVRNHMDDWDVRGREIAAQLAKRTVHYILTGFGMQEFNADELTLKIIEVLGESSTSFGLEEFMHGPNASFRKDMGIFVFQTDPRTLEKAARISQGIAISEAAMVVITDRPDAGWHPSALTIELPVLENSRQFGLFTAGAASQHLMYYMAIEKGMNPDINGHDIYPELGDIYEFFFPPGTH